MAKTASLNLTITGKDTTNIAGNSNIFGYGELVKSDITITDGDTKMLTLASGVTARDIFPSGLAASTAIEFFGFIVYDSAEPVATQTVDITIDGAAAATTFGDVFAFQADTSATLTTNAANSITVFISWFVKG
ncbi:MAG: hypothetical protein GWN62_16895 [Aliifodinibius sp.]|nr:hypothetical protein [Fodinibius sp.]